MKAKFKFYIKSKLLVESFHGTLKQNDLYFINQQQSDKALFTDINKLLSDTRDVYFDLSLEELKNYVNDLKVIMKKHPFRWGIVSNDPKSTALSVLIKNDPFFRNKVCIYSTLGAAIRFLAIDIAPENLFSTDYHVVE